MKKVIVSLSIVAMLFGSSSALAYSTRDLPEVTQGMSTYLEDYDSQMDIVYKDFVKTFVEYQKTKNIDLYYKLFNLKAQHDRLMKEKGDS